jgi:hypothetical protein
MNFDNQDNVISLIKPTLMQATSTLEQKKVLVARLIRELSDESEELKQAMENRDILLFRSFRLAHPQLFHHEHSDDPICIESLKQHFKEYLLTLSRMGFLTYYLDEEQ